MTKAGKIGTVVGSVVAAIVTGWLMIIGAVYAVGGVMTVEIVDRSAGLDLYLPVPMVLMDAAIASVSAPAVYTAGLPRIETDGVSIDFGELGPVVLELLEELDRLPDATLVEVVDRGEHVRISKAGKKLLVEVEEPGASIAIAIPTRGVLRAAGRVLG